MYSTSSGGPVEMAVRRLPYGSRVRMRLDTEITAIQKLQREGRLNEAGRRRQMLYFSEEFKYVREEFTREEMIRRLLAAQKAVYTLTKKYERKEGIKQPTGRAFVPLMLSHRDMEEKSVGELYNRLQDMWHLYGTKFEASIGCPVAQRYLELIEKFAARRGGWKHIPSLHSTDQDTVRRILQGEEQHSTILNEADENSSNGEPSDAIKLDRLNTVGSAPGQSCSTVADSLGSSSGSPKVSMSATRTPSITFQDRQHPKHSLAKEKAKKSKVSKGWKVIKALVKKDGRV